MMLVAALAGGTIHRARFVKLDTSADNTVVAAGANVVAYGVSQMGTRRAPQPLNSNTTEAAVAGEHVTVATAGLVPVEYGDTVAAGDLLKTDADGKAIPIGASAGTYNVVALAQVAGAAGAIGTVKLVNFTKVVS